MDMNQKKFIILTSSKNIIISLAVVFLLCTAFAQLLSQFNFGLCMLYSSCPTHNDVVIDMRATTAELFDVIQPIEKAKLFIFSLPRSGSSFLGEIFNREKDALYLYEPLHAHDALQVLPIKYGGENRPSKVLQDLFSCSLNNQEKLFQFLSYPELSNPHFRLMSKVLSSPPFCNNGIRQDITESEYRKQCVYINTTQLASICKDKKSIVIKDLLHRLPLYNPTELHSLFSHNNLKSVWLVRDPRAIISSMIKVGWVEFDRDDGNGYLHYHNSVQLTIHKVCNIYKTFLAQVSTILRDVYGSRLKILRYEDLMMKPLSTIYRLLKFVNVNLRIDTLNWMIENMHGDITTTESDLKNSFSIHQRNSSYSLTSWRRNLHFDHVTQIQQQCKGLWHHFGYLEFDNETMMHDLTQPSTDKHHKIFY